MKNNQICDNVLVLVTSMILRFIGDIMWGTGLGGGAYIIYKIAVLKKLEKLYNVIPIMAILLIWGSAFILASKEFEKETESNKIYAYSASIFALVSCIVAIITMFMGVLN